MTEQQIRGNDGTRPILDSIYEVYKQLGPGLLESVYEEALMIELPPEALRPNDKFPFVQHRKAKT